MVSGLLEGFTLGAAFNAGAEAIAAWAHGWTPLVRPWHSLLDVARGWLAASGNVPVGRLALGADAGRAVAAACPFVLAAGASEGNNGSHGYIFLVVIDSSAD